MDTDESLMILQQLAAMKVFRQSRLYESAPAYVTDQPRFVNGALAALTSLQPLELLDVLKSIEVVCSCHTPATAIVFCFALF